MAGGGVWGFDIVGEWEGDTGLRLRGDGCDGGFFLLECDSLSGNRWCLLISLEV
jgi:hypothetical protein